MSALHQLKQVLSLDTKQGNTSFAAMATASSGLPNTGGLTNPKQLAYAGLDDYRLEAKLGEAIELKTATPVAIKTVWKSHISPTQRASVLKEVQIMRTIRHPSIVHLKRFIETREHYFIVLELCEGGELFHRIVHLTYFSEELARHCICQVAEGIQYLHEEMGIVHRDIKPENILFEPIAYMTRLNPLSPTPFTDAFDEQKEDEGEFVEGLGGGGIGRVKIADFGLSKVVWSQETKTPCGTVGYTAPEMVRDLRYSKSVDMWALGCVLYTLLCGFPPFYDDSNDTLTRKVAQGDYTFVSPWWDPISASAKDLVTHLLCVNPNQRYTIDQFFQHPWITKHASLNLPISAFKRTFGHDAINVAAIPTATTVVAHQTITAVIPRKMRHIQRQPSFRSRIARTMKAVFNTTIAAHRMVEEKQYRKRHHDTFQDLQLISRLSNVEESEEEEEAEEEDDDDDAVSFYGLSSERASVSSRRTVGDDHGRELAALKVGMATGSGISVGTDPGYQARAIKSHGHKKGPPLLDLSLENASLLGKRKNKDKSSHL